MSFGSRLKKLMEERHISQTELAEYIGKGKSSVSQYISGKNIPRKDVQLKIAECLDCTVEFLNADSEESGYTSGLKNVPVAVAAKRLGKSEQFVRIAIQNGIVPFGYAVKRKTKYTYHISEKKLNEYIGEEKSTPGMAVPEGAR